jgi:hypothetical protein
VSAPREVRVYVVDRLEGRGDEARVILVADDDEQLEIPRVVLGRLAVEGAVLHVPIGSGGPEWTAAERDLDEERRRIAEASETLRRLSANDAGGDLEL